MVQNLAVTQASAWRRGYPILFPSNRVALIRPISIAMLLTDKHIPNELMLVIQDWMDKPPESAASTDAIEDQAGGKSGIVRANRKWMEAFAYAAMVNPRLSENPQAEDEISPLDMDDTDLAFLYEFLGRPAAEIAKFSQAQQEGNLESLFDVKGFFDPPINAVGGERSGESVDGVRERPANVLEV